MDQRYFAVIAAERRLSEITLAKSVWLRLQVKFLTLKIKLLNDALSPRACESLTSYDYLTLLVENLVSAKDRSHWCTQLSEHLDYMTTAVVPHELGDWDPKIRGAMERCRRLT